MTEKKGQFFSSWRGSTIERSKQKVFAKCDEVFRILDSFFATYMYDYVMCLKNQTSLHLLPTCSRTLPPRWNRGERTYTLIVFCDVILIMQNNVT